MRKLTSAISLAVLATMFSLSGPAFAQQGASAFDGKKFFEDLQSRGFKASANFDGKKFFEEVTTRGYNAQNKLDGKKFFEELSSRGFSAPAGFDGKKFFEENSKSWAMPPMVDMGKM